jgi:hypothetical protein
MRTIMWAADGLAVLQAQRTAIIAWAGAAGNIGRGIAIALLTNIGRPKAGGQTNRSRAVQVGRLRNNRPGSRQGGLFDFWRQQ